MPKQKKLKVWRHYHSLPNKSVKCTFCSKVYQIPNVTKMGNHLLKCNKCPLVVRNELQEGYLENTLNTIDSSHIEGEAIVNSTISDAVSQLEFTEEKKRRLTKLLTKAIFVTSSPLCMVEHELWKEFFEEFQPHYQLPTQKALSTTHLQAIYTEMEKEITEELRSTNHLHLQCDGWSNRRNEGVINFIIAKPEPIFVKSLSTGSHRHTSEYLSQEIQNVMRIYGVDKFVTLIGDNAKNIQKAFDLVKLQQPNVITLNCAAHTLNLLCHDIIKIETIQGFISVAVDSIKCIRKSQILNALFTQIVLEKKSGEQLKLPCKTRWSSHFLALNSLQKSKAALQCLAVHEDAIMIPADIKSNLLDEHFWDMINEAAALLEPISNSIIKLEGNKVYVNDLYMAFKDIKSRMTFMLPSFSSLLDVDIRDRILNAVELRKNHCIKPIHLAAYMLDPKSQGIELEEDEEITAMEFIYEKGRQLNLDVMADLANYRAREGLWGKSFVWSNLEKMSILTWWRGMCKNKPLSKVATCLLTAPCTSAATERSFSVHGNIHSLKRNRLTTDRAAKLAYIAYNWNLLHKQSDVEVEEDEELFSSPLSSPLVSPTPNLIEMQPSTSRGFREIEFININTSIYSEVNSDSESD